MTDSLNIQQSPKPDHVPEKFWNAENGEIRVDTLINSYKALEKKMSSSLPMPDSEENKSRVHKALGVPEKPNDYCVDCSHGLFDIDEDVNQRLHAKGLTQEQVQEVYDLAAEKMVPMIAEISADFQADREVEKLINHFGGKENWKQVSKQIYTYAKTNVAPDILHGLSGSFEGVLALHRMMKTGEVGLSKSSDAVSGSADEMDLQAMMRDPKYWRDRDPSTVKKVTDGFQTLYSE